MMMSSNDGDEFGLKVRRSISHSIFAIYLIVFSFESTASPMGGEIVGGSGVIEVNGTETIVQQETDRLAIDWQGFDVDVDERVEFVQPGQSSIALNRILGSNGSEILGRIDANGHVILVNPNGIVFGKNSVVNAGGLIASGLQISPDDFLNGELVFKGIEDTAGTIINSGFLNASLGGNIALLGKRVENSGLIVANLGRVQLAAGQEAVLTFDPAGLLGVQIDKETLASELNGKAAINNEGEIKAEEGQILLNASVAKDIFANAMEWGDQKIAKSVVYHDDGSFSLGAGNAVNNSGNLNVSGGHAAGDVIVLGENIVHTGNISADVKRGNAGHIELHATDKVELKGRAIVSANAKKSGDGGTVKILGNKVGLFDQSKVEAVAYGDGGQILVGGGLTGQNPFIKNADFVYLDELSQIDTSAVGAGDGGSIVLYAEDTLRSFGMINSQGGLSRGNGGFVETSGKIGLLVTSVPNLVSKNGLSGEWLIDPYNIDVVDNLAGGVVRDGDIFTSTINGASVRALQINAALESGASITIQTGSGGTQQQGNITVSAPLNLSTNVTSSLNLIAHNNIQINADIGVTSATGKLNLNLQSNQSNNQGSIAFGSGVDIATNGGDFIIGTATTPGAYNVNFTNAIIDLVGPGYGTGNLQYLAPSGRLFVNARNDITTALSSSDVNNQPFYVKGTERIGDAPKIELIAGNNIQFNGWLYDNNPTETALNGYVETNNASDSNNNGYTSLHLQAGNNIFLNANIALAYPNETALRQQDRLHISLEADADRNQSGNVVFGNNNGNGVITLRTEGGDFTVVNSESINFNGDTLDTTSPFGSGNINIKASSGVVTGMISSTYGGQINESTVQQLRVGDIILTADADENGTGNLQVNNDLFSGGGNITLSGFDIILDNRTLNSDNTLTNFAATVARNKNISLYSSSDFTLGNVTAVNNTAGYSCGSAAQCGAVTLAARNPTTENVTINQTGGTTITANEQVLLDLGSGNATLTNDNRFYNGIQFDSANNLNIRERSESTTGTATNHAIAGNVAGTLRYEVSQNGDIRNSGPLTVGGNATFLAINNDVILDHDQNDFQSGVLITENGASFTSNATLYDQNGIALGITGETFNVAQNLIVVAQGDITQNGVLRVDGEADFSANDTALNLPLDNLFTNLLINNVTQATIRNTKTLNITSATVTDSLNLNATNNLTQTNEITAPQLQLTVTGAATLNNPSNAIGEIAGIAGILTLQNNTDLTLNDVSVTANSASAITLGDGRTLSLSPASTLASIGGGSLTFNAQTVNLGSATDSATPVNITLSNNADLIFNNVTNAYLNAVIIGNTSNTDVTLNGNNQDGIITLGENLSWTLNEFFIDGGDGNDTLISNNQNTTWALTNSQSSFTQNANTLQFQNTENVTAGTGADNFVVTGDVVKNIHLGDGNDSIVFNARAISLAVNGGDGDDSIQGASGENTWQLGSDDEHQLITTDGTPVVISTISFSEMETLLGRSGTTDHLIGTNSTTQWAISAGNNGTVEPENGNPMAFSNMDSLAGGSGNDTFDILAGATLSAGLVGGAGDDIFNLYGDLAGTVDGGQGADTFNLQNPNISASIRGGEESGDDNSVVDTVTGFQNQATRWLIAADGTQSIEGDSNTIDLSEFERLQGADNFDDTFVFEAGADISLQLAGGDGSGNDSLDYSEITEVLNVELGNNLNAISGIEELIGNNLIGSTLTIVDDLPTATPTELRNTTEHQNTWSLSALNSGTVDVKRNQTSNVVNFRGFTHLTGEAVADTFDFSGGGSITGNLDGGDLVGGQNKIIGTNSNQTWVVNAADEVSATGLFNSARNLDSLDGGTGNDIFQYANNSSIVGARGGEGNDTADFSNVVGDLVVFIGNDAQNGFYGVEEVENVVGNANASYLSTIQLLGSSNANWLITAANTGTVTLATQDPIAFSQFNSIIGGNGRDLFDIGADLTQFDLAGTTPSITGAAGDDHFILSATISADLYGGEGNDQFDLVSAMVITGNIHGEAGMDTLQAPAENLNWSIQGSLGNATVNAQQLDNTQTVVANLVTDATGFEILQGNSGDDNFIFYLDNSGVAAIGGTGVDSADFSNVMTDLTVLIGAAVNNGLSQIETLVGNNLGQGGFNSVLQIADNTNGQWQVDATNAGQVVLAGNLGIFQFSNFNALGGGGGVDQFTLSAQLVRDDGSISGTLVPGTISAGAGNDIFILSDNLAALQLLGGTGTDELNAGSSSQNFWSINSPWSYVGAVQNVTANNSVAFQEIENIIGAQNAPDTLLVSDINNLQIIQAGNGIGVVDSIDYSAIDGPLEVQLGAQGVNGFENILGNGNESTLLGDNVDSTWTITPTNAQVTSEGAVLSFSQFGKLQGGSGNDRFILGALVQSIDGGTGNNTVDLETLAAPVDVGVGGSTTNSLNLENISDIQASGDFVNTLFSSANDNLWTISTSNGGTLNYDSQQMTFAGFNYLSGAVNNQFTFGEAGQLFVGTENSAVSGTVKGGTGSNSISVFQNRASNWLITSPNQGQFSVVNIPVLFEQIQRVTGGSLNDNFVLASANSTVDNIDGGLGVNTLVAADRDNTWLISVADTGTLNDQVVFDRIQTMVGGAMSDQITVAAGASIGNINAAAGDDQITLQTNTQVSAIEAGDGADRVVLEGNARVISSIDGGTQTESGMDVISFSQYASAVIIGDDASATFDFVDFERVEGATGQVNTLYGSQGQANSWRVTGMDSGTLNGLEFSDFAILVGQELADDFVIENTGAISGRISGRDGVNRLTLSAADNFENIWNIVEEDGGNIANLVNRFDEIQTLIGGGDNDRFIVATAGEITGSIDGLGGNNSLELPSGNNTWNIRAIDSGDASHITQFSAIQNLLGGSDVDEFILFDGASVTSIDGGTGQDRLDATQFTADVTVDLTASTVNAINVTGVENYSANDINGAVNLFIGSAADSVWQIDRANGGNVTSITGATSFTGFNSIEGGAGDDRFTLSINGLLNIGLNGGAGSNQLTAFDRANIWDISGPDAGSLSNGASESAELLTAFNRIQTLNGGNASDQFILSSDTAAVSGAINGRGGLDTLNGNPGGSNWTINNQNVGSTQAIGEFRSVEYLVGTAVDTYNLDVLGSVLQITNGAQVDLAGIAVNLAVGLTESTPNVDIVLENIAEIIASDDRLWADAGVDYIWNIDGVNSGDVNGTQFSGIDAIFGGATDSFTVTAAGQISGAGIDGRDGDDTLVSTDTNGATWLIRDLDQGELRQTSTTDFIRIENLIGSDGADVFDFSQFNSSALSGILDGGDGALDSLLGRNQNNEWIIDGANSGRIVNVVEFTGIENLVGQDQVDNFVFVKPDPTDVVVGPTVYINGLIDGGDGEDVLDMRQYEGDFFVTLTPSAKNDEFYINSIEQTLTGETSNIGIIGGDQNNVWTITAQNQVTLLSNNQTSEFPDVSSIRGGTAEDRFIFLSDGILDGAVDGNGGDNTIVAPDSTNTWTLKGDAIGALQKAGSVPGTFIDVTEFTDIQNLMGGSGDDTFVFEAGGAVSLLNGDNGTNRVILSDLNHSVDFTTFRFSVMDRTSAAVLVGSASNIYSVQTGSGSDYFNISGAISVSELDAGSGDQDQLNLTNYTQAVSINAQAGTTSIPVVNSSRIVEFANLNEFVANNNQNNLFTGFDLVGDWTLAADRAGSIFYGDAPADQQNIRFAGFSSLTGGSENDQFDLAEFSLTGIYGAGGINSLASDAQSTDQIDWTIYAVNTGQLNKFGNTIPFFDIQNLVGGRGEDNFTITSTGVLQGSLDGGAGLADTVVKTNVTQLWSLVDHAIFTLDGATQLLSFAGIENLIGSGSDWLQGANQNNHWTLTANGSGIIEDTDSVASAMSFSGFDALLGGGLSDDFIVPDTQFVTGFIDGGAGIDKVNITQESAVTVNLSRMNSTSINADLNVAAIESLVAEDYANTLLGPASNASGYSWTIKGRHSGSVIRADVLADDDLYAESLTEFSEFDRIIAGAQDDAFLVQAGSVFSAVDGGAGTDFLDFSAETKDLVIALGDGVGTGVDFTIDSIEGLVGNNDGSSAAAYQATLRVASGDNTWTVSGAISDRADGINDGVFFSPAVGDADAINISFIDFNNLQGGSGSDQFVVVGNSYVSGIIDGGTGTDTFVGNNAAGLLNIALLSAQDVTNATSNGLNAVLSDVTAPSPFAAHDVDTIIGNGNNTTLWGANGDVQWQVAGSDAGIVIVGSNEQVGFNSVANLYGRTGQDTFAVANGATLSGWLNGGSGVDSVTLQSLSAVQLAVADSPQTQLLSGVAVNVRDDVEAVYGSTTARSGLIANGSGTNNWLVDEANQGTLNQVDFYRFDDLVGSDLDDNFNVSGNGQISGLISGAGGVNRLDLIALDRDVSVSVGLNNNADLHIADVQNVVANGDNINSLYGHSATNNNWQVTAGDSGSLNDTLSFVEFANLIGGDGDDRFALVGDGQLSGYMDGGAHASGDVVDFSDLSAALKIIVGGDNNAIRRIERLVGNEQLELQGPDGQQNNWSVMDRLDGGVLTYANNSLEFTFVFSLVGGNQTDIFNLRNGNISGRILGGDGDDQLNIELVDGAEAFDLATLFNGGAGQDRVQVTGSIAGYDASYGAVNTAAEDPSSALASLSYSKSLSSDDVLSQKVSYRNVEEVRQFASVKNLVVNGTSGEDSFVLDEGQFTVNQHTPVSYRNSTNSIEVKAGAVDDIAVAGAVRLDGTLSLRNAQIRAIDTDALINSGTLALSGVQGMGADDAAFATGIGRLLIDNAAGPIYLENTGNLDLGAITTLGALRINVLDGSVSQSAPAISNTEFSLASNNSIIILEQNNALSGVVSLSASGDVSLVNQAATTLGDILAENLTLRSTSTIRSEEGVIKAEGVTLLDAATNISLTNPDNDFYIVSVEQSGSLILVDSTGLVLSTSNSTGDIDLQSQGLIIAGPVKASSINANTGTEAVNVLAQVSIDNAVTIVSDGANLNALINAATIDINAGPGSLVTTAVMNASDTVQFTAQDIQIGDELNTGTAIINAANGIVQRAVINSSGDVLLNAAGGDLVMGDQAAIYAAQLVLQSGNTMVLNNLNAGSIELTSTAGVTQNSTMTARTGDIIAEVGSWDVDGAEVISATVGNVLINSANSLNIGQISAGQDIVLTAVNNLQTDGTLTAKNNLALSGARVIMNENASGVIAVNINSTSGNVVLNAGLLSEQGDVRVDSATNIEMAADSLIQTDLGAIHLAAGNDVALGALSAPASTVSIVAKGAVSNNLLANDGATKNVLAQALVVESASGFGSDRAVRTKVDDVNITNTRGRIALDNDGKLNVTKLLTLDDINLSGNDDVTLSSGSINAFYDADLPLNPRANGEPSSTGRLELFLSQGSLRTSGTIDIDNPAISAHSATIITPIGDFGGPGLPPVIYTPESLLVAALTSWNDPIWGFGIAPRDYKDQSELKTNINDIGAGEQLVEVETLEEIDPAVFAAVKNYFYQDISILLPEDQRYEDEEY